MTEDDKKTNPLDGYLPDQADTSDPTFTYRQDDNKSPTLQDILIFLGWLVIVGGAISALLLGSSLETVKISSYTGYAHDIPHPYRWLYAAIAFTSCLCSGCLMVGLGRALKYLQEIKQKLD